eukprot:scaffold1314_cov393-Prasinococcus_capsulatus_cf.AAC.9
MYEGEAPRARVLATRLCAAKKYAVVNTFIAAPRAKDSVKVTEVMCSAFLSLRLARSALWMARKDELKKLAAANDNEAIDDLAKGEEFGGSKGEQSDDTDFACQGLFDMLFFTDKRTIPEEILTFFEGHDVLTIDVSELGNAMRQFQKMDPRHIGCDPRFLCRLHLIHVEARKFVANTVPSNGGRG